MTAIFWFFFGLEFQKSYISTCLSVCPVFACLFPYCYCTDILLKVHSQGWFKEALPCMIMTTRSGFVVEMLLFFQSQTCADLFWDCSAGRPGGKR